MNIYHLINKTDEYYLRMFMFILFFFNKGQRKESLTSKQSSSS